VGFRLATGGKIGSLHLLSVFERVVLPETVHEEISARGLPRGMEKLEYELVEADEEERFSNLDRGESAALSVAQELDDEVVFLTDDLEAREKAKELGIEVHQESRRIPRGLTPRQLTTDAVVEEGIRILEELKE
jgi:predicted nucleic acid-binding protein